MKFAKYILGAGIAAAIIAISYVSAVSTASAARLPGRPPIATCIGPAITGAAGVAVKKSTAQKRARIKWRGKAQRTKNLYSNWGLSVSVGAHYHCKKKHGTWRCSAHGYPCSSAAGTGR